jgi:2-hydroxychromene-2-carboxylate isomerase
MHVVIYGDFNCPYSYLASCRADVLLERGIAQVEWRAVEHDPAIHDPSEPVQGDLQAMLEREVAEVRSLGRKGERSVIEVPPVYPNTARAVRAFAATASDGYHDTRRRLFAALWADGRNLGEPAVVGELARDGAAGAALVDGWRRAWVGLERPIVPMLVLPDGYVSRGLGALARLADLAAIDSDRDAVQRSQAAT